MIVDGRDPWDDDVRYRRAQELLGFEPDELHSLHRVRLQDFYANAAWVADDTGRAWGPPLEVPSPEDCVAGVALARRVVDAANGFAARRAT
jgi:hypothetical protein